MSSAEKQKLHSIYLTTESSDWVSTGLLQDLNLPEINDSLLNSRIEVLSRPIVSLEGVGMLSGHNILLDVFFFIDRVNTYFCGLFEFNDKQFGRIKDIFIKNWYFGELYVAYGQGYLNEELRVLEQGRQDNKTQLIKPDIYPNCKWRLYSKKVDNDGNITWTSLISGIEGHQFNEDNLVKAKWGGIGLFLDWFDVAKEWVSMSRVFVQLSKLAVTKIKISVSKVEELKKEMSEILGWNFFYTQKDKGNTNDIEAEEFCDITDPKEFMNACMLYISQRMNTLGMVINPTNKAERMTTGEHYKDLKFSCNTEAQMLSNLAGFVDDLNINFKEQIEKDLEGGKLEVALTSSLSANGQPKTVEDPFSKFKHNNYEDENPENNIYNKFQKQF